MGGYLRALVIAMAIPVLNTAFMALAGFLQLRSLSPSWGEAARAAQAVPMNSALVPAATFGVLFATVFPHQHREASFLDAVRVRPLMGEIVALCFLAGACMQLPFAELGNLIQEVWPLSFDELARRHRLMNPTTWSGGLAALTAFVLVAPVGEELLFRGWLLPDLEHRYGARPALIWSSILFGAVHLDPAAIVYATLGGLVLGAIALRTKSTLASIAVHAGVNAIALLLPARLIRIEGFNTLSQGVEHISWWLLLPCILGAAGALAIVWRSSSQDDA